MGYFIRLEKTYSSSPTLWCFSLRFFPAPWTPEVDIANILWAFAKLKVDEGERLRPLLQQAEEQLDSYLGLRIRSRPRGMRSLVHGTKDNGGNMGFSWEHDFSTNMLKMPRHAPFLWLYSCGRWSTNIKHEILGYPWFGLPYVELASETCGGWELDALSGMLWIYWEPLFSQIWRLFFFSHGNSVVFWFTINIYQRWHLNLKSSWLVVWNHGILWLSIQLGSSSSHVTKSIIFQRGGSTTNQKRLLSIINHILTIINSILTIRVGLNHQPAKLWNAPIQIQGFEPAKLASLLCLGATEVS